MPPPAELVRALAHARGADLHSAANDLSAWSETTSWNIVLGVLLDELVNPPGRNAVFSEAESGTHGLVNRYQEQLPEIPPDIYASLLRSLAGESDQISGVPIDVLCLAYLLVLAWVEDEADLH